MKSLRTARLMLKPLDSSMAQRLHELSLDEDNRRFVPDEVFETPEEAADVLASLISFYGKSGQPQVYAVTLPGGELVGYVQAAPLDHGWELGYHIGAPYVGRGYATEAARAFLPCIMDELGGTELAGVCLADNKASCRVLEKLGGMLTFAGVADYQGVPRQVCHFQLLRYPG